MRLKYRYYSLLYFVLVIPSLSGCKGTDNKIESMYVLYYNHEMERVIAVDCDEVKKEKPSMIKHQIGDDYWIDTNGVLDTTIVDKSILAEISKELENAIWDTVPTSDARIVCKLTYSNGTTKRLCICGVIPNSIMCDDKTMINKDRLLYLIKSTIGYYRWMDDTHLDHSVELLDNTFKRAKVRSRFGKLH